MPRNCYLRRWCADITIALEYTVQKCPDLETLHAIIQSVYTMCATMA